MITGIVTGMLIVLFIFLGKYIYLSIFNKEKKKLWLTEKDRYKLFSEEQKEYLNFLEKIEQGGLLGISKLNINDEEQLENFRNFCKENKINYEQFLANLELYKGRTQFCKFCNQELIMNNSELRESKFVCPKCNEKNIF